MKKKIIFLPIILLTMAILLSCFSPLKSYNSISLNAAENPAPTVQETIFDYITITQENNVFSKNDFTGNNNNILYTNKTLTLTYNSKSSYDYFNIKIFNKIDDPKEITDLSESLKYEINSKKFYIFNINSNEQEWNVKISITHSVTSNQTGGEFTIIQTPINFKTNSYVSYKYKSGSSDIVVQNLNSNTEYPSIEMSFPTGTLKNPIYIDFNYIGNNYHLYSCNNKLYNAYDDSIISEENKLNFNKSGIYSVAIYDRTYYSNYSDRNYLTYNFKIKSTSTTTSPFYVYAHNINNNIIMNNQVTNGNVYVEFMHLEDKAPSQLIDKVKQYIDYITVTKSSSPTTSEINLETFIYEGNNIPSSLTFDEDGTYKITVKNKSSQIIGNIKFTILKNIKFNFEFNGTTYKVTGNKNTISVKTIQDTAESLEYNGIKGSQNYSFTLRLAESSPSISGVSYGASLESATVRIHGVGEINVVVTQDNSKVTQYTVSNGDYLPTFTEYGKYNIRITDEMGGVSSIQFKVTYQLTTPAIILIGIAVAVVVFGILYFIKSRSKVRVR